MKLRKDFLYVIILSVVCFLAYSNILGNDFVFDDEKFIVDRPETRSLGGALSAFTTEEYGIYRPIRTIVYFIAFKLFGLNAFFYHLFSILMHITVVVLIYFIIKKLFDERLAFFSSILFGVHPIHIERVTNATGSFDIVGLIFYLIAFYSYVLFREKNTKKYLIISLISAFIGVFSSEELLTLPFMILLFEFVFSKKSKNSIYYFFISAFYLFIRIFVLKIASRVSEYPGGSFSATLLTMPKVLLHYIFLTFFSFGLTPFRRIDFVYSIADLWFIVPVIIIALAGYLIFKYRRNQKVAFFSGWLLITMLMFLNIMPLQKIMAERYFFLASVSIFVLISEIFFFVEKKINFLNSYTLLVVIVLTFGGATFYNNTFWKNNFTLMSRGISLNPYDSKAHNNLGNYYFHLGNYDEAISHFLQAVNNDAENYNAWTNLGVAYSRKEQYDKSIAAFKKAIEITPYNYEAYDKLGIAYMNMGNYNKSLEMYNMSLYFEENYEPALAHLGVLYGKMRRPDLAVEYLQKAIKANPYYAEAYFNLGLLLESYGKKEEAKKFFRKAAQLEPNNKQYVEMAVK